MPLTASVRLGFETLESRDTPAAFGNPWPDSDRITMSFAPDGTAIGTASSNLGQALQSYPASAKFEILRAFQTWVAAANLNVGLVGDTGAAFGTGATVQGDPRFGDIRIGGRALPADVLAITAPYSLYDNHSGDVVLNTTAGGRDLFTIFLQEAGHSLGVGNSPDVASAMYEYYQGARTGLSAGDLASAQALYGPRLADSYEGANGNNTTGTATRYVSPVDAELTTAADVDVYRFTAGLLNTGVRINLGAAGRSLLTTRVELVDSGGRVVAVASTTDPTNNDLTLTSGSLRPFETYYVRVAASRPDVFGVGAYELEIEQSNVLTPAIDLLGTVLTETGLNDTLVSATRLLSGAAAVGPQTEFQTRGGFGSPSDVDYYRFGVPAGGDGRPVAVLTTVWGENAAQLNPWVEVLDAFGRAVPARVVTANGNTTTIQAEGLLPGRDYFLRVASDSHSIGRYHLAADLRTVPVAFDLTREGALDTNTPASLGTLHLRQSAQVHFVLAAEGSDGSAAELVVRDAAGNLVARVSVNAGRGRSVDLYLAAGDYRVGVRTVTPGASLNFDLGIGVITDPIGPDIHDPTGDPSGTSPPPPPPPSGEPPPTGEQPPPPNPPPPSNPPPPEENQEPIYWWTDDPYADGPMWY